MQGKIELNMAVVWSSLLSIATTASRGLAHQQHSSNFWMELPLFGVRAGPSVTLVMMRHGVRHVVTQTLAFNVIGPSHKIWYCTGHTLAPPLYRLQVGQATLDGMISDRFTWFQTGVQGSTNCRVGTCLLLLLISSTSLCPSEGVIDKQRAGERG
jgi:hypothetical protein